MPPSRLGAALRPALVPLLAVVLAVELVVNRVGARLVFQDVAEAPAWLRAAVELPGLFAFYFAQVLAVLVATLGIGQVLLGDGVIPRGARPAVATLAVAFVPISIVGLWATRLPGPLGAYLEASVTSLALVLALAAFLTRAPRSARWGMLPLVVPLAIHLAARFLLYREGPQSESWRPVLRAGEAAAVTVALLLPFLFRPRRLGVALGVTTAVLALALGVILLDADLAARVAGYGFAVLLPQALWAMAVYALGFAAYVGLCAAHLAEPGAARLRGLGLTLLGLAGYSLEKSGELAAVLSGVLCILASLEREQAPALSGPKWRALVGKLAASLGAPEPAVTGDEGGEEARLRVERRGLPVEVVLTRRGGEVELIEASCGAAPGDDPAPLSLTRRGTHRLGKSDGMLVETGDVFFDEQFRIRDARELRGADPLLADDLRPQIAGLVEGWLGVWPSQGARYRARRPPLVRQITDETPAGAARLGELLDLLAQLRQR